MSQSKVKYPLIVSILFREADVAQDCENRGIVNKPGLLPPPLPDIQGLSADDIREVARRYYRGWANYS